MSNDTYAKIVSDLRKLPATWEHIGNNGLEVLNLHKVAERIETVTIRKEANETNPTYRGLLEEVFELIGRGVLGNLAASTEQQVSLQDWKKKAEKVLNGEKVTRWAVVTVYADTDGYEPLVEIEGLYESFDQAKVEAKKLALDLFTQMGNDPDDKGYFANAMEPIEEYDEDDDLVNWGFTPNEDCGVTRHVRVIPCQD